MENNTMMNNEVAAMNNANEEKENAMNNNVAMNNETANNTTEKEIKTMERRVLEKATISWTAKNISNMVKNGKISFNNIVQRSYVWERSRKTGLIESMILGYPVPVVFAKRGTEVDPETGKEKKKVYDVLDGKQRLSTIKGFLNDEFALSSLAPVVYHDEEKDEDVTIDISEKKFSELPEALQDQISNVGFTCIYFDNLTVSEEREMFKRLNAGKPLSSKAKTLASCKDIENILDMANNDLFAEMLTDKAKDNKNQVTIVMKSWAMLNTDIDTLSFKANTFNKMVEETEISEDQRMRLDAVFNLAAGIHKDLIDFDEKKVAQKLYTETNLVSLVPILDKAIHEGNEEYMVDFMCDFFGTGNKDVSVSGDYNAAMNGSADTAKIVARHEALMKAYDDFFAEDTEEESEEEEDFDETVDDTEETED